MRRARGLLSRAEFQTQFSVRPRPGWTAHRVRPVPAVRLLQRGDPANSTTDPSAARGLAGYDLIRIPDGVGQHRLST